MSVFSFIKNKNLYFRINLVVIVIALWLIPAGSLASSNKKSQVATLPSLAIPANIGSIGQSNLAVIYVANEGADSNTGSAESPLKTLSKAVQLAQPGTKVIVKTGTYTTLRIENKNGQPGNPITFQAEPGVVLSTNSLETGAGIYIENASNLIVDGFQIRQSMWGIQTRNVQNVTIQNNSMSQLGQEGIHVKFNSNSVLVANNTINDTGNRPDPAGTVCNRETCESFKRYGEGIYLGDGHPEGVNDGTKNVVVHGNTISDTSAEAIEVKRGLRDIIVQANKISNINTVSGAAINVGTDPTGIETGIIIRGNEVDQVTGVRYVSDGVGIKLSSAGIIADNNLITNAAYAGIINKNRIGSGNKIVFNTIINPGQGGGIITESGDPIVKNNIGSELAGNIPANQNLFINPDAGDFRLACNASGAVNSGNIVEDITLDKRGVVRPQQNQVDFGAYEMTSSECPANPTDDQTQQQPFPNPNNNNQNENSLPTAPNSNYKIRRQGTPPILEAGISTSSNTFGPNSDLDVSISGVQYTNGSKVSNQPMQLAITTPKGDTVSIDGRTDLNGNLKFTLKNNQFSWLTPFEVQALAQATFEKSDPKLQNPGTYTAYGQIQNANETWRTETVSWKVPVSAMPFELVRTGSNSSYTTLAVLGLITAAWAYVIYYVIKKNRPNQP